MFDGKDQTRPNGMTCAAAAVAAPIPRILRNPRRFIVENFEVANCDLKHCAAHSTLLVGGRSVRKFSGQLTPVKPAAQIGWEGERLLNGW